MQPTAIRTRGFAWWILAGSVAAVAVACTKDALGPEADGVESVVVSPPLATVAVGSSLTLSAEVLDVGGDVLPDVRVSWASEDPSIADVSSSGVVTGRKVGTVLVAASSRGKDAFARITVNPTPVASVRLSTTHRSLLVGQGAQLTAEALDAGGSVLANRPIAWTTSDATIANVNSDGFVTATSPGAAIITAQSEGKSAVATIAVAAVPVGTVTLTPSSASLVVGQTSQLTAQVKDGSGTVLTGRMITWSTNRATVATVTSTGLVTAVSSGSATITATSEGRSASAAITVSPRPASAVIVSPSQVSLFASQTVQLTALVTDDAGQVLSGRPVAFASSNAQVATVSASGLITGITAGIATITATSEGASGQATVTVTPDPVFVVDVVPASTTIVIGNSVQLTATPRNAAGQPLTGRTVAWSSNAPAAVSVSSSGMVTGLAVGSATIVATIEGKQASAAITVRPIPVATVAVSPNTTAVVAGQSVTLSASTLDANGSPLSGRIVGWSSSDNAVATVSSTGAVTGVATGTATITASSEGQSGTAVVTVNPRPAASVTVAPATVTVSIGATAPLSATVRDGSGNVMAGASVTWSSANTAIATVSAAGVVTAVSPGSAVITATSGSASGSATVTVPAPAAPTIDRIVVTPHNPNVDEGNTIQLTATAYDANNVVIAGVVFTWTSARTDRATVDSTGLVRAIRNGNAVITASAGGKSGSTTVRVQD